MLQKKQKIRRELGTIPVNQPDAPKTKQGEVVVRKVELSKEEKEHLGKIETQLPGITKAVEQLEGAVPRRKESDVSDQDPVLQYVEWRKGKDFYGQVGMRSEYLTGRHLVEILENYSQASIQTIAVETKTTQTQTELANIQARLKEVVNKLVPAEDVVNEFEIVFSPTEKQLAKLGLLRTYMHLTTSVPIPNDLFVYQGTGSKGINIDKKAIGLHEALLDSSFGEAARTFAHEIAHNEEMSHETRFRHIVESLLIDSNERLADIATALRNGEKLTDEEEVILDIREQWNNLSAE